MQIEPQRAAFVMSPLGMPAISIWRAVASRGSRADKLVLLPWAWTFLTQHFVTLALLDHQ